MPDGNARAGGLEVAIRAALRRRGGLWFGWSGRVAEAPGQPKTIAQDNTSYITIDLRKDDYDEFYNGFANRVLWPILHYRLDLAEFTRRDLGGYFRVNEYFAKHLEPLLRPDDSDLGARLSSDSARQGAARRAATRTASASSFTSRARRRKSSPRCPITSGSFRRSATTTWSASRPRSTPPISPAISPTSAA